MKSPTTRQTDALVAAEHLARLVVDMTVCDPVVPRDEAMDVLHQIQELRWED